MASQPIVLGEPSMMNIRSTTKPLIEISRLRGLYVITDATLSAGKSMLNQVEQAIIGGARIVQYRDKSEDRRIRHNQARDLTSLCSRYNVPLIINDDAQLAAAVAADGVHLGRDDISIAKARRILGDTAIIGISCYADINLATAAEAQGADYVAFGSFFPSPTKPHAVRADVELLKQATARLSLPICAIGGITLNNASDLIHAGAHMLAVISEVFASPDPQTSAQGLAALF